MFKPSIIFFAIAALFLVRWAVQTGLYADLISAIGSGINEYRRRRMLRRFCKNLTTPFD